MKIRSHIINFKQTQIVTDMKGFAPPQHLTFYAKRFSTFKKAPCCSNKMTLVFQK